MQKNFHRISKSDALPVNKPYDTAERRPNTSPVIECFLVLHKQKQHPVSETTILYLRRPTTKRTHQLVSDNLDTQIYQVTT